MVPTVKKRADSSCVWRSICGVWESGEKGIKWNLGNGAKVNFWKDNWIPNHPPLVKAVCHHPELRNLDEVVADYAKEGVWLVNKIRFWFDEEIVRKIVAIPTPRLGLERDRVIWGPTCDGKFSISSAYKLGTKNNSDGSNALCFQLLLLLHAISNSNSSLKKPTSVVALLPWKVFVSFTVEDLNSALDKYDFDSKIGTKVTVFLMFA
ncbi:putative ribonuclease H protein At1g65750 family [Senna tora]|uniref:Putative ribonuclease H protein At1g65750 family n=1 Tax=Senna tora TaxID=362788 RepID=A0A834SWX4_9FABA|nr:putative ribonuclease H protein At1g65750 family [Senna tora]